MRTSIQKTAARQSVKTQTQIDWFSLPVMDSNGTVMTYGDALKLYGFDEAYYLLSENCPENWTAEEHEEAERVTQALKDQEMRLLTKSLQKEKSEERNPAHRPTDYNHEEVFQRMAAHFMLDAGRPSSAAQWEFCKDHARRNDGGKVDRKRVLDAMRYWLNKYYEERNLPH